MEELIILKKYNTLEEAAGAIELLEKNEITFKIEKEKPSDDIIFAGNTLLNVICIKIKPEDLEPAKNFLAELEEINIDKLEPDYYLFDFTDEELIEILQKPDEWSINDFHWALEILKQRGKPQEQSQLDMWKKKRLQVLATPDDVPSSQVKTAYFFCILGGIVGILMGRHIKSFKKTLPNGQKVLAYNEQSMQKGNQIMRFGMICLIAEIVLLAVFLLYN